MLKEASFGILFKSTKKIIAENKSIFGYAPTTIYKIIDKKIRMEKRR